MQDELVTSPAMQSAVITQEQGLKDIQQLAGHDTSTPREEPGTQLHTGATREPSSTCNSANLGDDTANTLSTVASSDQSNVIEAIAQASVSSTTTDTGQAVNTLNTVTANAVPSPSRYDTKAYPEVRDEDVPVVVGSPYRRRNSRHSKPKGILKAPPPPQAKFSFKRDILGYVVGDGPSLPNLSSFTQNYGTAPAAQPNVSPSSAVAEASTASPKAPSSSTTSSTLNNGQSPAPETHVPRSGGGLWRRLGGAVSAVAGNVPVPQSAVKTLNSITSSVRSPASIEVSRPGSPSPHTSNPVTASDPSTQTPNPLKADYIKSVRFTMSSLAVVYPINGPGPPGAEAVTRKRINKEYVASQAHRNKEGGWTTLDLLDLYEDCCRTREEPGIAPLRTLLMSTSSLPKVIDLRDMDLTQGAAAVLSDILSIDFGLRRLVLDNCNLDDESLKSIIHGLLISGSLSSLSLANNKRIHSKGWRILAYYMRRSSALKYLDVSDNIIDKKVADLFNDALSLPKDSGVVGTSDDRSSSISRQAAGVKLPVTPHKSGGLKLEASEGSDRDEPDPFMHRTAPLLLPANPASGGLTSLRLENCSLRNTVLESLANSLRHSRVKHVSLRRNRINQLGAVALAVLIRDYELSANNPTSSTSGISEQLSVYDTAAQSTTHSSRQSNSSTYRSYGSNLGNSVTAAISSHPTPATLAGWQPPRIGTPEPSEVISPSSSSSFSASDVDDHEASFGPERNRGRVSVSAREASRYAEMRVRLQKQIEFLPQVGHLLTLDVRSNEIKGGVTYISQVLKRNRTLRVLNLSDNRIDAAGLATLAEALKYNSTLETLDVSHNPCSGPSQEGIRALRTALVLNSSLMRLFLNNTGFDTPGAIALAEYLPDFQTLIHLDLTENPELSIAGIMALSASIKLNNTLRCLDLSIPANDAEFARLSQDILQSCVRNTELAQIKSAARGVKAEVATPIYKSELAKDLKEFEVNSKAALEITFDESLQPLVDSLKHCIEVFTTALPRDEALLKKGEPAQGRFTVQGIRQQAQTVQSRLLEHMKIFPPSPKRDALGALTAHMAVLLQRATHLYAFDDESRTDLSLLTADLHSDSHLSPHSPIRSPASPNQQVSSPSFSITDSDGSDCESSGDDEEEYMAQGEEPKGLTIFDIPAMAQVTGQTNANRVSSLHPTEAPPSPPPRSPVENHSRNLTLEEGEVFRRGISKVGDENDRTLLDVLDGQSDIAGEELKQEILETEVERIRRSSVSVVEEDAKQDISS